jgi:hypothetical protein
VKSCFNSLTGAAVLARVSGLRAMHWGRWPFRAAFVVAGIVLTAAPCCAADPPAQEPPQHPPRPIEPPHKPVQQGTRLAIIAGLNLLGSGHYGYNTQVRLVDGRAFNYGGTQSSAGATLFMGGAVTPPSKFRRLTLGITLQFGGLEPFNHPVIPTGTATPFSQTNLNLQVARKSLNAFPWRPIPSPYLEHELGSLLGSRLRLGYQYWRATGSFAGSFPADQSGANPANYHVKLSQSSHLIRLSINNHTSFDDPDIDAGAARRKTGFVQQAGLLIGTGPTVIVFVAVGPAWTFLK